MSKRRYVFLAFLVVAVLIGLAIQSAAVSGFAQMAIADNRLLGVLPTSTALAVGGGTVSYLVLIRWPRSLNFASEVVGELLRVTWPSREETVRASTTVVLTALFAAVLLGIYDFTWKNLADFVLFTDR